MRIVRVFVVAVVAALGLALLAPAVGASAPSKKNAKFCNAVQTITSGVQNSAGNSDTAAAKQLAKTTRKAAKSAPSSVKSAMNAMADYFQALADAGTNRGKLATALARNIQKYTKAAATFTKYYTSNCFSVTTTTT